MSRGCIIRDAEMERVDAGLVRAELERIGYVPTLVLQSAHAVLLARGDEEVIWPADRHLSDWKSRLGECLVAIAENADECPREVARRLAKSEWEEYRDAKLSETVVASWPLVKEGGS